MMINYESKLEKVLHERIKKRKLMALNIEHLVILDDKESLIDLNNKSFKSKISEKRVSNVFITYRNESQNERKIKLKKMEKEKIESDFRLSLKIEKKEKTQNNAKINKDNKDQNKSYNKNNLQPAFNKDNNLEQNKDKYNNENLNEYTLEKNVLLTTKIVSNGTEIN